jgi:hypothetical protein
MRCPASVALEQDCPDTSSEYADEGTAAHELAQIALTENRDADAYIGRVIPVGEREFTVDEDMAAYVQVYLDEVRTLAGGGELFVEQRVDFSSALGVEDSFGTSDAVIVKGTELILVDLKYGRGVQVGAEQNEQMLLYAIGGLDAFGLAAEFETVRLVIVQPRLGWTSDWSCSVDEVGSFAQHAKAAAFEVTIFLGEHLRGAEIIGAPGEKQCRFCKAKAICPALEKEVQESVLGSFEDLTAKNVADATDKLQFVFSQALGRRMDAVELIELWCKAVRARAEAELLQGRRVDGWKLVEGRRGARRWRSAEDAEATLKAMRLRTDEMYDLSLISPTTAEKRLKDSPRRWSKIKELIEQPAGKPSVAPAYDKRPALNVADDFSDLTAPAASGSGEHPFRQ